MMHFIYSGDNTLEAHMLTHMLEQHGITAQVHGEFLQGAVGELPVSGYIKVSVDQEDLARAQKILKDIEKSSEKPDTNIASPANTRLRSMIISLLIGISIVGIYFYVQLT